MLNASLLEFVFIFCIFISYETLGWYSPWQIVCMLATTFNTGTLSSQTRLKISGFKKTKLNVNWKRFKDILVSLWWMPWMGVSLLTYAIEVVYCIPVQLPSDSIVVTASSAIPTSSVPKLTHARVGRELFKDIWIKIMAVVASLHRLYIYIYIYIYVTTGMGI